VVSGANTVTISSKDTIANAILGDSFISVTSGTNTVQLTADAIVGGANVTVVSGANTVTISSKDTIANAILGDSFISVTSGTNTVQLTADAIISNHANLVVTSGTSTVTLAPALVASFTSISATTVTGTTITGTTGQFSGELSGQSGNFSTALTVSGVPVNTFVPKSWYDGTELVVGNSSAEQLLVRVPLQAGDLPIGKQLSTNFGVLLTNNTGGNTTFTLRVKHQGVMLYQDVTGSIPTSTSVRAVAMGVSYLAASSNRHHLTMDTNIGAAGATTSGVGDFGASSTFSLPIIASGIVQTAAAAGNFDITIQLSSAASTHSFKRPPWFAQVT